MLIFDAHVHIFPDKIAAQTTKKLGDIAGITPSYDGSRNALVESMRLSGIDAALNCPIATKPEQVESINQWALEQNHWPVFSLGTVHPEHPDSARILKDLKKAGMPGIKLHPEYQQFNPTSPVMQPIWQTCADLGIPVLMHCGADIGFSPPYHSSPVEIRALLETFPRLQLVAAHFGSWNMWEEVEKELIGTSVFFDISFTNGLLTADDLVRLARNHGIEKILFGTDAPWRDQKQEVEYLRSLQFTNQEMQLITSENALQLFKLQDKIPNS